MRSALDVQSSSQHPFTFLQSTVADGRMAKRETGTQISALGGLDAKSSGPGCAQAGEAARLVGVCVGVFHPLSGGNRRRREREEEERKSTAGFLLG